MNLRTCIARSLGAQVVLLFVLFVAGFLWWLLGELGDDLAEVMKGLVLVTTVCWGINFVVLVSLLALVQIGCCGGDGAAERDAPESPPSEAEEE